MALIYDYPIAIFFNDEPDLIVGTEYGPFIYYSREHTTLEPIG